MLLKEKEKMVWLEQRRMSLNVIRNFIINLSGNIAGAALLTNVL